MENLRNYINRIANQHTEPVDNDAIWAGIEQKIVKPKKERRFIPFLIWGLLFSFVSLSILGLYYSAKHTKSNGNDIDSKSIVSINQTESNNINPFSKIKSSKSELSTEVTKNNASTDEAKIAKFEMEKNSGGLEKIKNSISSTQNNKRREIQNHKSKFDFSGDSKNEPNSLTKKENSILESVKTSLDKQQSTFPIERRRIEPNRIPSSLNVVYKRPKIDIKAEYTLPLPMSPKDDKNLSFLKSFSIYTQYGFGSMTIQGDSEYATLRNESEELLEQIRLGIESDLISLLDFTLYAGVSYVSINDKVSRDEIYYEDREITYLKSISIAPDGTEIENYATEDLPHLIRNRAIRYNSHRLVSIPIGMRFGKYFSSFYLGVGFGLDINYHLSDMHTILDSDSKLMTIPVGGRWLSPSFHTAIVVEYPISDNWYIHSKITYRNTTLENISIENDLKENYKLYGIDLGLKVQF